MNLPSYFSDMLTDIRPPQELLDKCVSAHTKLREYIEEAPELKDMVVTTFLQGSYRRSTLIRPSGGSNPDVDVVVVTNLHSEEWTPAQVQDAFCRALDKHPDYKGNYRRQGRSIGLSGPVNLDLVITAAPSEALSSILKSESFGSASTLETNPDWGAPQYPVVARAGLEGRTAAHPRPRCKSVGAYGSHSPDRVDTQEEQGHQRALRQRGQGHQVVVGAEHHRREGDAKGLPHRTAGRATLP